MMVNRILHRLIRSLSPPPRPHSYISPPSLIKKSPNPQRFTNKQTKKEGKPTGTSMHSLKDFSSSAHPVTEYPDDAQHPSTEDIIPTHGFVSALLARRTRSLGKGGRRGAVVIVRGGIFSGRRFGRRVCFFLMVLRGV